MRNKLLSVKFLVIGSLVLGTLAWTAPAMAGGKGDRSVPPGFLIDKDAFSVVGSQAEPAGTSAFSKFSLRLYGGYNHMLAGDVNEGSDYYYELVEAYVAEGYGSVTGGYKPLHGGYNFGADLIYQITRSLGVGVGAGFMRSSADSLATFTNEDLSVDLVGGTMLSAVPIRLGLFFTAPLGGKLDLIANAGAAYYAGLKFTGMQGLEYPTGEWERMSLEASERSGADIGFHGSLGFEYKFSPTMGFFVEAVGRYAKFKNFESVTGVTEDDLGGSDPTEGLLYIITQTDPDYPFSTFTIVPIEEAPPVDNEFVTYREPKFDLGGFSLQAGFRIRF